MLRLFMSGSVALYRRAVRRPPRARLELEASSLVVTIAEGRVRRIGLNGARFVVRDATRDQRFVRHLTLLLPAERVDLMTPSEEGAIAPRAARLPGVPKDAIVVEVAAWEAAVDWLQSGGRLGGRTVTELARLACAATPQFAIAIGEWAAQVAVEMTWERAGPMRGGGELRELLRPLEAAATRSARAADALVAALARSSRLRPIPSW